MSLQSLGMDSSPDSREHKARGGGVNLVSPRRALVSFLSLSLKSKVIFLLSLFVGLAWLGPIIFLLHWNFTTQVVGPRVGSAAKCPDRNCSPNNYTSPPTGTNMALENDYASRDTIGALQVVAKALEVWFIYNACSLIWIIMRIMLTGLSGLPTSHLTRHVEVADPFKFIESTFWSPLRLLEFFNYPRSRISENPRMSRYQESAGDFRSSGTRGVYLFTLITVVVATIVNFMGPATAILLIPRVTWLDGPQPPQARFLQLNTEQPVNILGCSSEDLLAGHYECVDTEFGSSLDSLVEYLHHTLKRSQVTPRFPGNPPNVGLSTEGLLSYFYNITVNLQPLQSGKSAVEYPTTAWAPNRHLMQGLMNDFIEFANESTGLKHAPSGPLAAVNNSIDVMLERSGPIVGLVGLVGLYQLRETVVDAGRTIRCYTESIAVNRTTDRTVCFRSGKGWDNLRFSEAMFNVSGTAGNETVVTAKIYDVENPVSR